MTKKTCTFIGFNSNKLSACWDCEDKNGISLRNYLKGEIEKQVIEQNISYFICGVGSEGDMYIAETILEIKKRYPHIILEVVINYETQVSRWREADRNRYYDIIEKSDKETMFHRAYSVGCWIKCNYYMIDQANTIFVAFNPSNGVVCKMIKYAKDQSKTVNLIDPMLFKYKSSM